MKLKLIDTGKATRYPPGLMQVVVKNRLEWEQITQGQVDAAAGFVALQDRAYLGRWVLVEWPRGAMTGPYLVVDCGREADQDHLDEIHFAVDLSYELAEQFLEDINMPRWGVRVWLIEEGEPCQKG